GADRQLRDGARHVPPRRRPLSDDPGGPRRPEPAAGIDRPLGRPLPQDERPARPVGPPILLPQPGRERPPLRPLLARRRRRARRRRAEPRRPVVGGQQRLMRAPVATRGFTFVEMAVVMAIIGLAIAVAVPAIDAGLDSREVRRATRQIAATMHYLRGEAV